MARTIGVDPGDALVKIVELDGSYRKPRLVAVHTESVTTGLPKAGVVATAVRAAIDDGMKGEVRLGHPCREAVLRTIDLPFKGPDAIRKVVKAEVEGEIHGFAVDDMVVDFLEVGGGIDGGSRVLVAAVPKDGVRAVLTALEAAAVEPETVDLDTMALWRAADQAGAFDAAAGQGDDFLTAVVDVGSRTIKVLLVAKDKLVDMRVLRLGALAVADEIAQHHGLALDDALHAIEECTRTGAACQVTVANELPAAAALPDPEAGAATAEAEAEAEAETETEVEGEGVEAAASGRVVIVQPDEVEAARASFLQRLHRELIRYLTSCGRGDVGALWTTGGGCRMPGVDTVLAEAFSVTPRELDVLAGLQHKLDDEQVRQLGPRLTTAIGLALQSIGGPTGFDLRREDLASTRGFERIKFPLTITLMVALLALFVYGNGLAAKVSMLHHELGKKYSGEAEVPYFGHVHAVLAGGWWKNPQNFQRELRSGSVYKYKDLLQDLDEAPVHERLDLLHRKLALVAEEKQKKSGVYEDVSLPSGYAVLVRFSEVMNRLEPQLGRYLLTKLDLSMRGDRPTLAFTIGFRGEDFRQRQGVLEREFQQEFGRSDSPFMQQESSKKEFAIEKPFKDGQKTGVPGAFYDVTVAVRPAFDPFGGGAQAGGR